MSSEAFLLKMLTTYDLRDLVRLLGGAGTAELVPHLSSDEQTLLESALGRKDYDGVLKMMQTVRERGHEWRWKPAARPSISRAEEVFIVVVCLGVAGSVWAIASWLLSS
jgi:hypothetical protein